MGNILIATDKLLSDIKPDAVLVLGDTNSCISILAAKKEKSLHSILKPVIDVLILGFQKKLIEKLLIT